LYITQKFISLSRYLNWEQTKVCLDALRASEYKNLEIIVVDHGSTDKTKIALPVEYPEVVHVLGDPSLWWTGATNLGIRTAMSRSAERIMLLNNDCYITPKAIGTLIHHSEKTGETIIAPAIQENLSNKTMEALSCWSPIAALTNSA